METNNKLNRNIDNKDTKILITSALPYANNIPHLGNIIGCVLSADVFARFCRSKYGKEKVLFVCGTDEHGTTTETKAEELKKTPEEVSKDFYDKHSKIYNWFQCSFDIFGRTSSENNKEVAQDIFKKLDKNGFIIEKEVKQLFCEKCNRFLADRFVEGTCPKCGYEDARGDQCDNCSTLLDATDLINPKCKICNSEPLIKIEKHLFIDLLNPELKNNLETWVKETAEKNNWSQNARTITESWLRDGLKQRCITRSLKWGVPVPRKGYENKVFYSWFDAPIGYIGITKDLIKDKIEFNSWWHSPDKVKLYQFMGKDNIPFHTILFPSFLIGAKDNYTLLHQISSTEYLNYEDSKFSKSRGTGVFGDDAIKTGIPVDIWRYFLLSSRPETSDTIFTWKNFQEKTNNELLANLGNFVNRSLVFLHRNFNGEVPECYEKQDELERKINSKIQTIFELLENIELRKAINEIMALSKIGNEFFQKREPWKHKEDKEHVSTTLYYCVELVRKLAILISPYLPITSKEIFSQLNLDEQNYSDIEESIKLGHKINKPEVLFKKIEDKKIKEFHDKFSGSKKSSKETEESKKIEFKDIELKVAKIIDIEVHPKADKLYIETIDLGNEQRKIVSGLVPYYSASELRGKKIIVICNLKPANLRGVESQGMLLAAEDKEGNIGVLLAPDSEVGERVYIKGQTVQEDYSEINFEEFLTIKIKSEQGKILVDEQELTTNSGSIVTDKNINGLVR